MIENGRATLHECQTVYSVQDVYEMVEIVMVGAHNKRKVREWAEKQRDG